MIACAASGRGIDCMTKYATLLFVVLLSFACSACGTSGEGRLLESAQQSGPEPERPVLLPPAGLDTLAGPWDAQFHPRSTSAGGLRVEGGDYLSSLPNHNVTALLSDAGFTPGGSNFASAASAVYEFDTSGYSGDLMFSVLWSSIPPASAAYFGVANFTTGRWDWFNPLDVSFFSLGAFDASYRNGSGNTYLALVLTGSGSGVLNYLRIGDNRAPVPQLTADPPSGGTADSFTLDASGSTDPDGTIANYSFFANNTVFDNGTNPVLTNVHFDEPGDQFCVVTVTDDDGQQEQANVTIPVGASPHASLLPTPSTLELGTAVDFDASGSSDDDGSIVKYEFDPENSGSFFDNGANPNYNGYVYAHAGYYNAILRVTDNDGHTAITAAPMRVGWRHTFDTSATLSKSVSDAQGNLYVCGRRLDMFTGFDGIVFKYSPDGQLLWSKLLVTVAIGTTDDISSVALDNQGHLDILCMKDANALPTKGELLVMQLNTADGSIVWQRRFGAGGGPYFEIANGGLCTDSQDRINFCAQQIQDPGDDYFFVGQFDSTGNLNWQKEWLGGNGQIVGFGCSVDDQDNFYVSGLSVNDATEDQGLILSMSSGGTQRWAKNLGLVFGGHHEYDHFYDCCFGGGKLYAVGTSEDDLTLNKYGLSVQLETDGSVNWAARYSADSPETQCVFSGINYSSSGNMIVSANIYTGIDIYRGALFRFNPDGSLPMQKFFIADSSAGGRPSGTADGGIYFVGGSPTQSGDFQDMIGSNVAPDQLEVQDLSTGGLTDSIFSVTTSTYSMENYTQTGVDAGGALVMRYYP